MDNSLNKSRIINHLKVDMVQCVKLMFINELLLTLFVFLQFDGMYHRFGYVNNNKNI